VGELTLGTLDAVPPALRYRVRDVYALLPRQGEPLEGIALERLSRLVDDGMPWLGVDTSLAGLGYWMIEARHSVEMRRRGCLWLTMFPSVETVERLRAITRDADAPGPVREQAICTLGLRELRSRHPSTLWTTEAVQLADEELVRVAALATTAGKVASEELPIALRHVQWDGAAAVFARAPGLWGEALECFATPALARVLLVSLDDIPPQHRLRVIRLVGAVLGEEAVPLLVVRAASAPIEDKLEMLFAIITIAGEAKLGLLEDTVRDLELADLLRQRARWHLRHPGVFPTVRGLRTARATAVIPPNERATRCAQAADDLGALTRFARHTEAYLYTLWAWMVRGAADPIRARDLVAAYPESQRLVRDLYLEDLARRGRVKQLTAAAQSLHGADIGAMHLAIWGRPLAALELAGTARLHTVELVLARALACYRSGRPDLTERILSEDLPPSEVVDDTRLPPFPGPDEQWWIDHAPSARPAIVALAGGRDSVLSLARPAPTDADPDTASLEPIATVVRRVGRELPGSTVYLAGDFKVLDRDKITAAIEAAGARIVNGPFPGTDFYVHGDWCLVQTIAQLERQGARRLRPGELEVI
jgi:hypothetical protein